jgi:hypothetical protein
LRQVPDANGTGCAMTVTFAANLDNKADVVGIETDIDIEFEYGDDGPLVAFGSTADPGTPGAGNSTACPSAFVPGFAGNCSGFELFCTTPEIPHSASSPAYWVPAVATLSPDGRSVRLVPAAATTAATTTRNHDNNFNTGGIAGGGGIDSVVGSGGGDTGLVARGSRYAWAEWPLASLFSVDGELPILPWNQMLTCTGGAYGSPC